MNLDTIIKKYKNSDPKIDFLLWFTENFDKIEEENNKLFEDKLEDFENKILEKIKNLLEEIGVDSKTKIDTKVLRLEYDKQGDVMFNLSGGRYLVELNTNELIDNLGYQYNICVLTTEQLCQVVDSF